MVRASGCRVAVVLEYDGDWTRWEWGLRHVGSHGDRVENWDGKLRIVVWRIEKGGGAAGHACFVVGFMCFLWWAYKSGKVESGILHMLSFGVAIAL